MGNCQAVTEAATVSIQHPGGRVEKLYWPTTAGEVMRLNVGHHVAICVAEERDLDGRSVRLTRVRLLKPKDPLLLGLVYRLVSSQEVAKALRARKQDKMKRAHLDLIKHQQLMQLKINKTEEELNVHQNKIMGDQIFIIRWWHQLQGLDSGGLRYTAYRSSEAKWIDLFVCWVSVKIN